LAIELDGATHDADFVKRNDQRKALFLKQNNISLLRFSDEELLKHYDDVLAKIRVAVS
jgi:very-short-patch-repair endonuclease